MPTRVDEAKSDPMIRTGRPAENAKAQKVTINEEVPHEEV